LTTGSPLSKRRGYSPISAPYYHPKICGKPAALQKGLFTEVPRSAILRSRYAASCITLSSEMFGERSRTGK
jgi:hypothetical protein